MNAHLKNIDKAYDSGFSLRIDDLEIDSGQRVGLVGNNGAGKTTLINVLLGLTRYRGAVHIGGGPARQKMDWRRRTGSYLGESSLIRFLTPQEYWRFVGQAYGLTRDEIARRLEEFASFAPPAPEKSKKKKYIREYSLGNKKKIGLIAALLARPSLLVLDEPLTSLDPRSNAQFQDLLLKINAEHGTSIILSSHDLVHVVELCNRILVLDEGKLVYDGGTGADTLKFLWEYLTGRASDENAA